MRLPEGCVFTPPGSLFERTAIAGRLSALDESTIMPTPLRLIPIEAEDVEVLDYSEAASRAGRSISWVRRRLMFGPLQRARQADGRPGVTADSLTALLIARRPKRRPRLQLVVDNT